VVLGAKREEPFSLITQTGGVTGWSRHGVRDEGGAHGRAPLLRRLVPRTSTACSGL